MLPHNATEPQRDAWWQQIYGDAPGYARGGAVDKLRGLYDSGTRAATSAYSRFYLAAADAETDFVYHWP